MKFLQLTLLAAVFQLSQQQANIQPRIANGTKVDRGSQMYQVQIMITYYYNSTSDVGGLCTGSLISNRHILTARHCVDRAGLVTSLIMVFLGSTKLGDGKLKICERCWDIFVDDRYTKDDLAGDIAVITLLKAVHSIPNIKIIGLPTWSDVNLDITGKNATVSGWGHTYTNDTKNEFLYSLEVVIASQETCKMQTEQPYHSEVQFCSITENSSTCEGDSGGPVVVDGKLFGITSWGNTKECSKNSFNVATKVTPYLQWISKVTGIRIKN